MTEEIAVRIAEALESIGNTIDTLTVGLALCFGVAIFVYVITKD